HAAKMEGKKLLTLEQARANRTPIDWSSYVPPKPEFLGMRVVKAVIPSEVEESRGTGSEVTQRDPSTPLRCAQHDESRCFFLRDLIEYIDWSPFFHAWELRGRYPAIFDDPKIGKEARELFHDAQELLERIAAEDLLIPHGVYAFWPANAVGDDIQVYADDARTEEIATFYFLRQQMQKPPGQRNHCLADYVASVDGGQRPPLQDYLGGFAVSIPGADELAEA